MSDIYCIYYIIYSTTYYTLYCALWYILYYILTYYTYPIHYTILAIYTTYLYTIPYTTYLYTTYYIHYLPIHYTLHYLPIHYTLHYYHIAIQKLSLASNNLRGLPDEIAACTTLEELYLSNNAKFSYFPGSAGHLRYIVGLYSVLLVFIKVTILI